MSSFFYRLDLLKLIFVREINTVYSRLKDESAFLVMRIIRQSLIIKDSNKRVVYELIYCIVGDG